MAKEAEKKDAATKAVATQPKKANAPVYTVDELRKAPQALGKNVTSDIVVAAFAYSGKTEATIEDAKDLVNKFLKKGVK